MKKATFRRWLAAVARPSTPLGMSGARGMSGTRGRLLDLGCAMGSLLEVALELGWEPHGVELSSFAAKIAAERIGADRIHSGRLEDAGLVEGSFAVVTMCDYLEHVPDPSDTLARVRRLLAPGGRALVVCPDNGAIYRRLFGRHWIEYKLEHLFYFEERSLRILAKKCGFRVVRFTHASKAMTIDYLAHQAAAFEPPVVGPLLRLGASLAPDALKRSVFPIYLGNFLAVLEPA
jgi:cyclopropane fatty-acyl-phospholipid synthase-like methyltransferase